MSWHALGRGEAVLHGCDVGAGLPVVFQHGLGGDEAQVAEVFPDGEGFRRLTLECRGHGRSGLGNPAELSMAAFADDLLAFADARGIRRFVAGGISMGAAIALRLAVRAPQRVAALVLARPAWLWQPAPENMRPFAEIAACLSRPDAVAALADFERSPTGTRLAREAPDNLATFRRFLTVPNRSVLAALLGRIAGDGPGISEAETRAIAMPTLVIGHRIDAVHPFDHARTLADCIGGSQLTEITPKATDKPRHVADFRAALSRFLNGVAKFEGGPQ